MAWIRLATAIIVFVTICIGFGYFADSWIQRRRWPDWTLALAVVVIAFLWPVVVVTYTIYDAQRYLAQHPHDDAPGMVVVSMISVGAPFLFVASIPPTVIGAVISRRRSRHSAAPTTRWTGAEQKQ
jgi:RsiW-degrading membrane proteinase PrsW (M82 family)